MASAKAAVEVADRRHADGRLRLSWHPERRMMVVSQWRGGLCVASTQVELADLAPMAALMIRALGEAATSVPSGAKAPTLAALGRQAITIVQGRLRAARAPVVNLAGDIVNMAEGEGRITGE